VKAKNFSSREKNFSSFSTGGGIPFRASDERAIKVLINHFSLAIKPEFIKISEDQGLEKYCGSVSVAPTVQLHPGFRPVFGFNITDNVLITVPNPEIRDYRLRWLQGKMVIWVLVFPSLIAKDWSS
jgi:hypothetical protein